MEANDVIIGDGAARLMLGDCLERLRGLGDNSVDAVVTDPPYELGFMGKSWDASGIAFNPDVWREALRVLKPGGHLLAFSSSRTYHRMACAIEDAGFEIRDQIMYVYGSGFPKSMDVSKQLDKMAGAEREVVQLGPVRSKGMTGGAYIGGDGKPEERNITAPATDAARQWQGWGTALKPAHEPICMARKPLAKGMTVAANVLQHGTGAVNVDGCRVASAESTVRPCGEISYAGGPGVAGTITGSDAGRWPANLIHDGSDEVLALFPDSNGSGGSVQNVKVTGYGSGIGTGESEYLGGERQPHNSGSGSAARFFKQVSFDDEDIEAAKLFYCAKASRRDRNEGLEDPGPQFQHGTTLRKVENAETKGNNHPTVKPVDLCKYLCRLITPPGGLILDPFMGSGSTGKAAMLEGFRFIGCELSPEYLDTSAARIEHAHEQANPEPVPAEPEPQLSLFG